jgi:hypothetical protein
MRKKDEEIFFEMYRQAFKKSTPSADFDKLLENATINKRGEKEIPFMDYECEHEVLEDIFNETLKKFKVPKYRHDSFKISYWLGPIPKTKKK